MRIGHAIGEAFGVVLGLVLLVAGAWSLPFLGLAAVTYPVMLLSAWLGGGFP